MVVTRSIWTHNNDITNSLSNAMKTAEDAEVGYVWVLTEVGN